KNYTNLNAVEYTDKEIKIEPSAVFLIAPIISEYITYNYIYDMADEILSDQYEDYDDFLIGIAENSNTPDIRIIINALEEKFTFFSRCYREISLDGFVLFAFNEFKEALTQITEKLIFDIKEDEDIEDFIGQLNTYVHTKPSLCDRLHIVVSCDGSYKYFNINKKDITNECLKNFYNEFQDEYAGQNDILLSTLIIKLPREIVIHKNIHKENENLFNTIYNIFGNRLKFCCDSKCNLCKM
ncbi:MAG: hypothetical protein IJA16_03985, partial [Clostridia bacterium]|nr:hypothetical protein [Clostridia bacterium]